MQAAEGGCWCGSATGVAPGWRCSKVVDGASPEKSQDSKPKPSARSGCYQSPRPLRSAAVVAAVTGGTVGAATPPAPQTLEWDAVYAAINSGGEAELKSLMC